MKRCTKGIACLAAIVMLVGVLASPVAAIAQPRASDYISDYYFDISASSGGNITVTVDVTATGVFAYVGFSSVSIQVYENSKWTNVATYSGLVGTSQIMGRNTASFANELTYKGTIGKMYRAIGAVYCGKDSSYINCDTRTGLDTGSVTAK